MWISAHNKLLAATAVTVGGFTGAVALTDPNVMRQRYMGDLLVASATGAVYGDTFIEFPLPAAVLVDCCAVMLAETPPAPVDIWVTLKSGGSGGVVVDQRQLGGVFDPPRNIVGLHVSTTPVSICDYVRFDFFDAVGSGALLRFKRFFVGERLNLAGATDVLGFVNEVQPRRSEFGQPITQNLGFRREVGLVARFQTVAGAVTPLASDAAAWPLLARAGYADEVLVMPSHPYFACIGHFAGDARLDGEKGANSRLTCKVREY